MAFLHRARHPAFWSTAWGPDRWIEVDQSHALAPVAFWLGGDPTWTELVRRFPSAQGPHAVGQFDRFRYTSLPAQTNGPTLTNAQLGIANKMSVVVAQVGAGYIQGNVVAGNNWFLNGNNGGIGDGNDDGIFSINGAAADCGYDLWNNYLGTGTYPTWAAGTYDGATVSVIKADYSASNAATLYSATAATSGAVTDGTSAIVFNAAGAPAGFIHCGIWNRPLSMSELAWLRAEPYAFLRASKRRLFVRPASGTSPDGIAGSPVLPAPIASGSLTQGSPSLTGAPVLPGPLAAGSLAAGDLFDATIAALPGPVAAGVLGWIDAFGWAIVNLPRLAASGSLGVRNAIGASPVALPAPVVSGIVSPPVTIAASVPLAATVASGALQAMLAGSTANWRGLWVAGSSYAANDGVYWQGAFYIANAASTAVAPSLTASVWNLASLATNYAGLWAAGGTRNFGDMVRRASGSGSTASSVFYLWIYASGGANTDPLSDAVRWLSTAQLQADAATAAATGGVAGAVAAQYRAAVFAPGVLVASQVIFQLIAVDTLAFPANFAGSLAACVTVGAGPVVLTLTKNGTSVGTITYAAGAGNGTFVGSAVTLVNGDILAIVGPATADANFAGTTISLRGTRS